MGLSVCLSVCLRELTSCLFDVLKESIDHFDLVVFNLQDPAADTSVSAQIQTIWVWRLQLITGFLRAETTAYISNPALL